MRNKSTQKLPAITANILSYILPGHAVQNVCNHWFSTHRTQRFRRQFAALQDNNDSFTHDLTTSGLHHYYWPGNTGIRVLCVHGWSGWGLQFSSFARQAQSSGLSVSSFDAPAHGACDGRKTNLIELSKALLAFGQEYGPFDVVVAHSYGLVVTLAAIESGLDTKAIVSVASPANLYPQVEKFINYFAYNKRIRALFEKQIAQRFGADWWTRNAPVNRLPGIDLPGLILHDHGDPVVPVEDAMSLHRAWQDSELCLTRNQGHHKILHYHKSIKEMIRFIEKTVS